MPLWQRILRLALPSIATFSSMTLTGMLTLIIIGRLGPAAIAVVGISNILMYNTWAFFAGINESVNYLISQHFGEGTMDVGNRRLQIGLVITLACDIVWMGASLFLPHDILTWMGVNQTLVHDGTPYLRIRMLAFVFSMFTNVFYAYMRGVGDTKTPMLISLVTNGLLIILTYVLSYGVFGWHGMGLIGAALSMLMTEGIGLASSVFVHYVWYAKRFNTRVWLKMSWKEIRFMLRESTKLSLMELSMSVGMLVFTTVIARLGTAAVAANEIALNILSLGFMPANGFGAAATIIVGQEIGARRPLEAKRGGLFTVGMGLVFMALFSVFLWLFALPIAQVYTSVPSVYVLAVSLIHIASFIQLFDGGGIVLAGGLRGAGDTTYLFRMSLILNFVLFIPLTILLTMVFHLGQAGAWIALCTLIVAIGVANAVRFLKRDWYSEMVISNEVGTSTEAGT